MADAPVRELPAPARFEVLALIEASLREEPIVWRLAGRSEEELRERLVAAVGLAAVFARGAAAGRKVSPEEVVAWVRARI